MNKVSSDDFYLIKNSGMSMEKQNPYKGKLYKGNVLAKRKDKDENTKSNELVVKNIINLEIDGREKWYYPKAKT